MNNPKIEYTEGSGNVYKDLGFANHVERLAKAKLAMGIEKIIEKRKLTQVEAAEILGISQPKVSALMNGTLSGFSMEKLIHLLNILNQDVEIIIHKTRRPSALMGGKLKVSFA